MNAVQKFTLFDIGLTVLRSPTKFFCWFLLFFFFVAVAYLTVPRKYGSDGKLFVQVGRSSVGATPTTSAGKVSLQDSRETEVKSVVGLLGSRELANRVIDVVGVERILKPNSAIGRFINDLPMPSFGGGTGKHSDETDLTSDEIDALNRRNKAVRKLMKSIEIAHEKNTTLVSIGIKSGSPFLSQDIVNSYLDEYRKKHVEVNTPQAAGFFNEQLKIRKAELVAAEKKVQEFRSQLKVLDIGSARSLLQREIDQLKLDALGTEVKFKEAQEKTSMIEKSFAAVPEYVIGADKRTSSLARDKAREALYNLELEESELSAMLRSGNPKLVAIREAVKKAKGQLKQIPLTFMQAEKHMNPAHKEILVMLTQASADANGLQKRLEKTNDLIALKIREVDELNRMTNQENRLTRDVDICRKTMLSIADKTAESMTLDALDNKRISNVTIAQPASLIPRKVFPSGLAFAAIGTALSALLATIMLLLKEFQVGEQLTRKYRQIQSERPTGRRLAPQPMLATAGPAAEIQQPLHQELQSEIGDPVTATQPTAKAKPKNPRQRSEQQAKILMFVGGFTAMIAAYVVTSFLI